MMSGDMGVCTFLFLLLILDTPYSTGFLYIPPSFIIEPPIKSKQANKQPTHTPADPRGFLCFSIDKVQKIR